MAADSSRTVGALVLGLVSLFTEACNLPQAVRYPEAQFTGKVIDRNWQPTDGWVADICDIKLQNEAGQNKTLRYMWPNGAKNICTGEQRPIFGDVWTAKKTNQFVSPTATIWEVPNDAKIISTRRAP